MEEHLEQEGLQHLANIEQDLEEIKKRTPTQRRAFIMGLWQGAGALVGSILAVVLLGAVLSFFGIIPGLGQLAHYLQDILANLHARV